jgi:ubiquinone/menaquinone biosynthesis C-methylase UbiE/uncharacterized protein YbaR (Trm112 family)
MIDTTPEIDPWYLANIVCPRDHQRLRLDDTRLVCPAGHAYPIVDGVPVMLLDDVRQTIGIAQASIQRAHATPSPDGTDKLYLDTLGVTAVQREGIKTLALGGQCHIDPVVAFAVNATNGNMYKHLVGKLRSYPIPELRMPFGNGQQLLDIGCSWGRWSIAAARKGYAVVGVDPSLGAIMAARRVSDSLGLTIKYVVADARHLPFSDGAFDNAFSYSVVQHFSREDAGLTVHEIGRILKTGGSCLVQLPSVFGLRCLYQQARHRFRAPVGFQVRYWTIPRMKRIFESAVGSASVSVDCFFGIGLQESDAELMPPRLKAVLALSKSLRVASRAAPFLKYGADSVYVTGVRR